MSAELKIVLKSLSSFNDSELECITNEFKTRTFSKNEIILKEGSICKEFYFVRSGSIRTCFIDKSGHEKTRYIMLENYIGTALASFISQKPSLEFLEALESSELLAISRSNFFRLVNEMESWKTFYIRMLEMAYSFQTSKIEALVTLTATQRYEQVMRDNPSLVQRVSNKVLASFLDIREETLSRLKSK